MRHLFGGALLASLLMCTGCVLFAPPDTISKIPPQGDLVKAPPPVLPEQVTAENCTAMMQALWDETDRDYQRLIINPSRE